MENPFFKEKVINQIFQKVEDLGFNINRKRVVSFIDNFLKKYQRLPQDYEIKPIVLSYMKICKEEDQIGQLVENEIGRSSSKNTLYKNLFYNNDKNKILMIPKPEGRRICPICEPTVNSIIHEMIDKTDILCDYPRVYGKKYRCGLCGMEWKEF